MIYIQCRSISLLAGLSCYAAGLTLFFFVQAAPLAWAQEKQNVLVLHSYHKGFRWTDDITTGIEQVFGAAKTPIDIQFEYMDTKKIFDAVYQQQLIDLYSYKFKGQRFDVIISSDDNAFNFLRDYRDTIFPGTPVVYCGTNYISDARAAKLPNSTGVNETASIIGNLELINQLHPEVKTIVVIADATTTGKRISNRLAEITERWQGRFKVILLQDLLITELEERLAQLPAGTAVLYTLFLRDRADRFFSAEESIQRVTAASPVPVYVTWDFSLGYGAVGGLLTSGLAQGKTAAQLALRVLAGEAAGAIPRVEDSPNVYMFDDRGLERYAINRKRLPDEAIILNQPDKWLERYRALIWKTVGIILGLLTIIAVLASNVVRRRRAETALKQVNEELEERVRQRTWALQEKNIETEEAYKQLKVTQSQLLQQEKMASIGQLAAGVAHEINNPMGFISANLRTLRKYFVRLDDFVSELQNLMKEAPENLRDGAKQAAKRAKIDYIREDAEDLLEESLEGAERVKEIVQGLKSFSRVDQAERKAVDLNECLESTINIVWNEIKYKAELKKELGELPPVNCYPQQLNQVFMNILVNAAQAIEKQGTIKVRSWAEGEKVCIAISDDGVGIPEERLNRIFEPFFTTKEVGQGTGLGMSIAYDIVQKHKGEIRVNSVVDEGTTFTIVLPKDGVVQDLDTSV